MMLMLINIVIINSLRLNGGLRQDVSDFQDTT